MTRTLTHRFTPHGVLRKLWSCRDAEVLIAGPAGTGKSRAALEKLNAMMLANPGARGLMLRKTGVSLTSTGLVTFRTHVIAEALRAGLVTWYGGSQQESAQYRYSNGSVLVVGGMDKSTKIMSSEYDVIYVQEATELTEGDWEACTTRLRHGRISFQQLMADCNPDTPTHWLKARCDRGQTTMLESRHEDNPTLFVNGVATEYGAAYMSKLDNLTGVRRDRLRFGRWVAAEGVIYEEWDSAIHLVDRFDIPDSWTRWWTIDFGYTNPFVCQWWAQDPDGKLYLYREIYHTKRLVEDHARQIMELVRSDDGVWLEPKPRAVICDHDAEGRATLQKHIRLSSVAAFKTVTEGVQAVQARMKAQRLFILRDSVVERDQDLIDLKKPTCTAEEIPGYIWDVGIGKAPKEQPLKADDHGCDAMRYLVAEADLAARPRVRRM